MSDQLLQVPGEVVLALEGSRVNQGSVRAETASLPTTAHRSRRPARSSAAARSTHGMIPSMSRKGDCFDNACAERFFSTLKNELVHHQFPSASDDVLGAGKWAAGPTAVALTVQGPWVFGALANNLWTFAGDSKRPDFNQMLIQPFVNYNLPGGWYLTSSPVITANWQADSANRWTVPIGAGAGKIFRIGKQPLNAQLGAYYNAERPKGGPDWTLRFQIQFLFPK